MPIENKLPPLDYDDVLLLPSFSQIQSRESVSLVGEDGYIPIFSAPMASISEWRVVIRMDELGGVGILHRFFKYDAKRYKAIRRISEAGSINFGIAISVNNWQSEFEFVKFAADRGANFIAIDTASGYLKKTVDAVERLRDFRNSNGYFFKIISGNVVDYDGAYRLAKAGTDLIRVNIGTGIQCLTSKSIGIGRSPLTAINDCAEIKYKFPDVKIIADGGIYNPGRALKSLVFGADAVMIGSLFGRATEAKNKGKIFGMSSYELQDRMNKSRKSNEGIVTKIPKKELRPLAHIFDEFRFGLQSGLSYLGIDNIVDIHKTEIEYMRSK